MTRKVLNPPVTYHRLARVAASAVGSATTAVASAPAGAPARARMHAARAPVVTAMNLQAARRRVISAVGRMTSRQAAVAQPCGRGRERSPDLRRSLRRGRGGCRSRPGQPARSVVRWVGARLSGRASTSQQPAGDRADRRLYREACGRADAVEAQPGSDRRNDQGHEQVTDWTLALQHRRTQCQQKSRRPRAASAVPERPQAKAESDA
jgi:hypothetical protein